MGDITKVFANAYRSKRLVYRDFEKGDSDIALMYKFGPGNPANWGFINLDLFKGQSMESHSVESKEKHSDCDKLLKVLICLPSQTEDRVEHGGIGVKAAKERQAAMPIGYLLLYEPKMGREHTRTTSLDICIGEEHQNRGYGTEALSWAVDWAFNFANAHKVEMHMASYNERAVHLCKKVGLTLEGRKREILFFNSKYYDTLSFGILQKEWRTLKLEADKAILNPRKDNRPIILGRGGMSRLMLHDD